MGSTRILYTDATTAEAIIALKGMGFIEVPDGGLFLSQRSPIKIYSVWGKAAYYPELLEKVSFTPRIQVHFKCAEPDADLNGTMTDCAGRLLKLANGTRIIAFDVDTGKEISLPAAGG